MVRILVACLGRMLGSVLGILDILQSMGEQWIHATAGSVCVHELPIDFVRKYARMNTSRTREREGERWR